METIKLGIVDDDKLIVELLTQFFNKDDQFSVELKCFGGLECLESLKKMDELPEIILIDLKMEGMDGTELLKQIRAIYPEIKWHRNFFLLPAFIYGVYSEVWCSGIFSERNCTGRIERNSYRRA